MILTLIIITSALIGCASHAVATYRHEGQSGTTTITVQSPDNPVRPPVITVGDVHVSGGVVQTTPHPDQALAGMSATSGWLGGLLIVSGIAALIVRFWLPYIPVLAPIVLIAAGGGLLMLPVLVDRYSLEIGLAIAAAIVVGGYELWTHRRDLFAPPPDPSKPKVQPKEIIT